MGKMPGRLVIVGGHEDKEGEAVILREFVRLAGGAGARIAVLTAATELPEETADEPSATPTPEPPVAPLPTGRPSPPIEQSIQRSIDEIVHEVYGG